MTGYSFAGKLAVVTGAGSGFGRATCIHLAARGARIVAADIDPTSARETVTRLPRDDGQTYEVDVSDATAMEAFAEKVRADHGVPDIVVNNAGIAVSGPFLSTSVEHWERILGVNLWGIVHGSRLFGAQMAERNRALPKSERSGHIVNVASAAAFTPLRGAPSYSTTKAAAKMLSECLRAELAPLGIGVTAVCPGFANTGIADNGVIVGVPDERAAILRARGSRALAARGYPPEKVAARIATAIEKNRAVVPVNFEGHLTYALSRLAPSVLRGIARLTPPPA